MSSTGPYATAPANEALDGAREGNVLPAPIPFGKYYLLEKIATGGMAEVFKAKAFGVEGFERLLAVKKILPTISEDTEFISMFIDEAKIAGRLNHANIAQIFDLGKAEGSYFIALEYVSGSNARQIFERCRRDNKKLGIDMACYVVMKACEGLDYAHNKTDSLGNPLNIVHRDVSPQNVLVSYEGEVKVIDFGIAKAAGKSTQTQVGILKGKFSYMSPEQVRGLSLDRRSDIFSLSICLYELLTLERLFLGESDFETLEKIRKVDVAPPSLHNPHIPKELEELLLKGLAKDPNERFQTAAEFQDALQKFMFNQPIYFTNKDLAARMQASFYDDLRLERKKLEYYQTLDLHTIQIQTGEIEASAVMRGSGDGLEWGDDEIATTVFFDTPEEKGDLIDDLADYEGNGWDASDAGSGSAPTPISDDDIIEIDDGDMDAWDRLVTSEPAKPEPGRVTPLPTPRASGSLRPSGIYGTHRRRSSAPWIAALVALALMLGAGAVYLITSSGGGVELVFAPEPSRVQILLGDRIVHDGETPFTYEDAEPGTHTITIVAEGYEPLSRPVTLEAGHEYNIRWRLNAEAPPSAGIRVSSEPAGAAIWIDGTHTGSVTPSEITDLVLGPHQVRLEREGYLTVERTVAVTEQLSLLDESLHAAQFSLDLSSEPVGASYFLTEQDTGLEVRTGRTPAQLTGLDGAKSYLVIVRAENHRVFSEIISPSPQRERGVQARLVPVAPEAVANVGLQTPEGPDPTGEATPEVTREPSSTAADEAEADRRRREAEAEAEATRIADEQTARRDHLRRERDRREREAEAQRDERVATAQNDDREPDTTANDTPPAPTEPGLLRVQSRPAAQVYVNGQEIGWSPIIDYELPPGSYRIRLVNEEFGLDHMQTVRIVSGESADPVIFRQE